MVIYNCALIRMNEINILIYFYFCEKYPLGKMTLGRNGLGKLSPYPFSRLRSIMIFLNAVDNDIPSNFFRKTLYILVIIILLLRILQLIQIPPVTASIIQDQSSLSLSPTLNFNTTIRLHVTSKSRSVGKKGRKEAAEEVSDESALRKRRDAHNLRYVIINRSSIADIGPLLSRAIDCKIEAPRRTFMVSFNPQR